MNIRELVEQAGANFEHIQWVERDLAPLFERFAELVAAHTLMNIDPKSFMTWHEGFEAGVAKESEECIQNVLQQYEGFGTEHQGVEYVKQRIVEAIRARSKA
jgi:hypothetical protein